MITLAQARRLVDELAAEASLDKTDLPLMREAWNDYTDSLARAGELTARQLFYCPEYKRPR